MDNVEGSFVRWSKLEQRAVAVRHHRMRVVGAFPMTEDESGGGAQYKPKALSCFFYCRDFITTRKGFNDTF
jgi:hypothetical protein